jgi:hypothetical protein
MGSIINGIALMHLLGGKYNKWNSFDVFIGQDFYL